MAEAAHLTGKVPSRARDPRLDFFRGLALMMIFIDHVPGQFYENLTTRNFGFSDAAEGFVFMSGTATAIAYGPRLKDGLNFQALRKIWGRAWQLYIVHLFITACALAIFAAGILYFGGNQLLLKNGMGTLLKTPLEFLIGTVTLTNQLSYVNILPLYSVLLLTAPFTIILALRKPKLAIAISAVIWMLAGYFQINFPTYPSKAGWFLNPFSWQLIFVLGIFTGLNMRAGERFVPVKRSLIIISGLYLAFAAFDLQSQTSMEILGSTIVKLKEAGIPAFAIDFMKPYATGPRLLHIMALVYILSLPWIVPKVAASRYADPIRIAGKHSLPIFALGTILAFVGQAIKTAHETNFFEDTLIIFGGIAIMIGFAYSREWLAQNEKASTGPAGGGKAQEVAEPPVAANLIPFKQKLAS
ncbi:OpgC family protein [Rhizobium sp. L1K21]|uniref:OpgC family protein n=1 Tax=Rhizobium sp. L1K21 TaxID=2954933 RepID=UPI0020934428|nr:OpgC domain-containing protein [Rhizobium sp. L1K21]MCO6184757.1 OpgC domain-containing protein [Rhizobium sp. L1K21]